MAVLFDVCDRIKQIYRWLLAEGWVWEPSGVYRFVRQRRTLDASTAAKLTRVEGRGGRREDRAIMTESRQFDILSPRFHADPFPTLNRMRAEAPVVRMKLPIVGRTWLAITHDACATLLKDHETFARDPANAGIRTQARILNFLPRTLGLLALNMLGQDDPEHRRLRGLVDQAFQRRTIEAMKPTIAAIADRLLDRLEGRAEADLMAEFCRDLPLA